MQKCEKDPIIVVGAGIVGLSIATLLRMQGHAVQLVDEAEPGKGCSYGNAGIIATSFIEPLSDISTLLRVPRLLFNQTGPLAIRARNFPQLAPWLLSFAANALPAQRHKSLDALKALNLLALPAWRRMLSDIGSAKLLVERGVLEVVRKQTSLPSLDEKVGRLRMEGLKTELIDGPTANELEPHLSGRILGAALYSDMAHVTDPYLISNALFRHFMRDEGSFSGGKVTSLQPTPEGVAVFKSGRVEMAEKVVVCAGLWSRELLKPFGLRIPVVAERGYHLNLDGFDAGLTRPVGFHDEAVFATPMTSGLRLAGTVELAKAEAPANWQRAHILRDIAKAYIPSIPVVGGTDWMGCRPSFPDSLPGIGRLGRSEIFYAFGHQHLGLTQAAVTAELIAAMVNDRRSPISVEPYSLARFQ
jgi:D-hydroxyproline dehydrogenase